MATIEPADLVRKLRNWVSIVSESVEDVIGDSGILWCFEVGAVDRVRRL